MFVTTIKVFIGLLKLNHTPVTHPCLETLLVGTHLQSVCVGL
jgi:hypothetical protein